MELLKKIGKSVQEHYQESQSVLSFGEYLEVVQQAPGQHMRNAAQYARDMFDHFGEEQVRHPTGTIRRFKLFDAPFDQGERRLVGQEEVQNEVYRILHNFVRQGRVDRFILLHGPNGSSKSTITEMLSRGLEHYSKQPEGAAYRFLWIFPAQKLSRGGIGFANDDAAADATESFAHLEEEQIDARLPCELSDHPLLLIPRAERASVLQQLLGQSEQQVLPNGLLEGDLCPRCKQVYDALLKSHGGDYMRVLRHVQVERFEVSRRYRQASARVEPQLAVDARANQITADRSISALPTALQSTTLFELSGDLVQANRGVIDYADLLKRPVEAYKYLLSTVEEGRVVLDRMNLFFDLVFLGSSNEIHLKAFMESPEWMSFKGRMELVRVPYLLDHRKEQQIYDDQVHEAQMTKHIAPHANAVAALWAVLSRLHRPSPKRFAEAERKLVTQLKPLDKAELYSLAQLPADVRGDDAKTLRAAIKDVWQETRSDDFYEGASGASPREVKNAIQNAAQDARYGCLSPEAVLRELGDLVQETSAYRYLQQKPEDGYYDHTGFIELARAWYLDRADEDVCAATGLVDQASYMELFVRYMNQVTHFVRNEKLHNPITGDYEEPDARLMAEVEKTIGAEGDAKEYRQGLMTRIGAWSVDHSGEQPDYAEIFAEQLEQLKDAYFGRQLKRLGRILRNALRVLAEESAGLEQEDLDQATQLIERMQQDRGYCEHCAREALSLLVRERYAE